MWQGNIIAVPKETGLERVKLIHAAQVGTSVGCFERGNEPAVSIKCGHFLDILICLLLKNNSGP
jgi:hypothetical protein